LIDNQLSLTFWNDLLQERLEAFRAKLSEEEQLSKTMRVPGKK
jgi:hypothetical protein